MDLSILRKRWRRLKRNRQVVFWCRDLCNIARYGRSAPVSGQRLWLDPNRIRLAVDGFRRGDSGRVLDGDWDLERRPVTEFEKIRVVYRKLREGISWEEAGAYELMLELMQRHQAPDGC